MKPAFAVLALALVAFVAPNGRVAAQQAPQSSDAAVLSFDGDTALWTVAIKPDRTADFEQVLAKLRDALARSDNPQRRQQAAGWKVMRMTQPLPDGNVGYVHIINPVVPGADYALMPILYEAYPDDRMRLYELYRGAFAANVALAIGNQVANLGAPETTPPRP